MLAVDGVHFGQLNPGTAVENSLKYFVSRKDKYALLCIAGCDAECRFLVIDISQLLPWAGPSRLGTSCPLSSSSTPTMPSTSRSGPVNDGAHLDFDYHQSSNRVVIERAFGILIRRWGILWRPLEVQFRRRAPLIKCCMLLHNFCIDKRVELNLREQHGLTEIQPGRWEITPLFDNEGRPVEHLKTQRRTSGVPGGSGKSTKRVALIAEIEARGLKRPKRGRKRQRG